MNRHESAANRAKAPITGAFVERIRCFDPQAKVTFVSEGAVQLGKPFDYSEYSYRLSGRDMALWDKKRQKFAKFGD